MSVTATRCRKDSNQTEIIEAFRALCWSVQPLYMVGHGVPDLLVCSPGGAMMELVEIKSSKKATYTADEVEWSRAWPRVVHTVITVEDVAALVERISGVG